MGYSRRVRRRSVSSKKRMSRQRRSRRTSTRVSLTLSRRRKSLGGGRWQREYEDRDFAPERPMPPPFTAQEIAEGQVISNFDANLATIRRYKKRYDLETRPMKRAKLLRELKSYILGRRMLWNENPILQEVYSFPSLDPNDYNDYD